MVARSLRAPLSIFVNGNVNGGNNLFFIITFRRVIVILLHFVMLHPQQLYSMEKVGCLNPGCDRPKSLKQVVTLHCWILGNRCEYQGSLEMTICHSRFCRLKVKNKVKIGDVFIRVKHSLVGQKNPTNKANTKHYCLYVTRNDLAKISVWSQKCSNITITPETNKEK